MMVEGAGRESVSVFLDITNFCIMGLILSFHSGDLM